MQMEPSSGLSIKGHQHQTNGTGNLHTPLDTGVRANMYRRPLRVGTMGLGNVPGKSTPLNLPSMDKRILLKLLRYLKEDYWLTEMGPSPGCPSQQEGKCHLALLSFNLLPLLT